MSDAKLSNARPFAYADFETILPERPQDANKSNFGHLLIVGGNIGFNALSGIIGGLLAQGFSLMDVALKGSALHAHAADIAAKEGEQGLLASDVIAVLRQLIKT